MFKCFLDDKSKVEHNLNEIQIGLIANLWRGGECERVGLLIWDPGGPQGPASNF